MSKRFLVALTASVGVLALATPALAQDAAAAPAAASDEADDAAQNDNDIIIVTGTAGGAGMRKQDASFAITTLDTTALSDAGLKSTAEAFTLVPGVWAESSGGKAGANIDVRGLPGGGDAPFVTFAIGGAPLYGTPSLSFFEQSTAFRIDETIASVEALRGGPSAVFGRGEPGVTMNFRLKEGQDETHGVAKFTTSDYGLYQVDGVLSGHLAGDFYYMVGGYWSTSPGIRDAGFQSEQGLQGTAQLTWRGSRGKVNVFTRWTDDVGQWYLPMSLISGNNLGTFSQLGPKTRYVDLQVDAAGNTRTFDFKNGRGWRGSLSGLQAEYDLTDNLTIRDNMAYLHGSADTYGLVPDGGAVTVANSGIVGPVRTANGVTLSGSDYIQYYGRWVVQKDLESFTNDLSLAWKTGSNELTIGYYRASYSSDDFWSLGNARAVHNVHNGDYLDTSVTCVPTPAPSTTNPNPVPDPRSAADASAAGCWAYGIQSSGESKVNAVYIADSFEVTDKLRVDAGVRREWLDLEYIVDSGPGYPDGNPDILPNHTDPLTKLKKSAWAYTAAANYAFTDSFGAFVRYSDGFSLPMFDDIRDNHDSKKKIKQLEGGLKYTGEWLRMYATAFHNTNDATTGGVGSTLAPSVFKTKANGIELDGNLHFGIFNLGMLTTYQDSKVTYSNNPLIVGKRIPRQPKFQFRLSPNVDLAVGDWNVNIFGALANVGHRYADYTNGTDLKGYTKVDAGIRASAPFGVTLAVQADNLLNSHGLTEGDGRSTNTTNSRPILGRSFRFSIGYDF